ncbi:MAG: VCBS repeat-containing protein [Planctomycetota bacterium]
MSAVAPAQRQFEPARFVKPYLPQGDDLVITATGDVDGDGDLDLAGFRGPTSGLSSAPDQAVLLINDGTGVFADETAGRMPPGTTQWGHVAFGDVDGDGDLDLALTPPEMDRDRKSLYLNDGAGVFTDVTATRMPARSTRSSEVAFADMDGDGDQDLVFGGGNNAPTLLYRNDGNGTFDDATALLLPPATLDVVAMVLGDVDGDGDVDLILSRNRVAAPTRLLLNDGTGKLVDASATHLPPPPLVANERPYSFALADFDGDTDLDLVLGYSTNWDNLLYLNDGSGVFAEVLARLPQQNEFTVGLAALDVDRDGDLDLALANTSSTRVYLNNGTATFFDAPTRLPEFRPARGVIAADVNDDGDPDLHFGKDNDRRLYLNDRGRKFVDASKTRLSVSTFDASDLALADVDRDGDLDLLVADGEFGQPCFGYCSYPFCGGYVPRLYRNDGQGAFTDVTGESMLTDGINAAALAVGDVDADGDEDVVVGAIDYGGCYSAIPNRNVLLINGAGVFSDEPSRLPPDRDTTFAVELADVDGDGDLDLLTGNFRQRNRLYLNDGLGTFRDVTAEHMPRALDDTRALAVGDIDGDGDLDLLWGNEGEQNRLHRNDGQGRFTDVTATQLPTDRRRTLAAAFADVDGDGDLDLVLGNEIQPGLYLNDGAGTFFDASDTMPIHGDDTTAMLVADVDEDGDVDVILGNADFGVFLELAQDRLYVNDGSGRFADATTLRLPPRQAEARALVRGDLDGDGDLDLVVAEDNFPENAQLLINHHRQLAAPRLALVGGRYDLELFAAPGYGATTPLGVVILGAAVLPRPVHLPGLGAWRLEPPLAALPAVTIPMSTGRRALALTLPPTPALQGASVQAQAALVDGASVRLTGLVVDTVGQ